MLNINKLNNIRNLTSKERCDYFVRKVADFEVVWGLFNDGWVTSGIKDASAIAFWPEKDFATLSSNGVWKDCKATEINLTDFMENWLPEMMNVNQLCCIFPMDNALEFLIHPKELLELLQNEIEQYE